MEIIKTLGSVYFGSHRPWYETDNPFVEHFQLRQPCIIKHHNRANEPLAEYTLDQFGFRSVASQDAKLWFMGCSDTFGEALAQHEIYAQQVADALGCEYYNFGTPGAGIEIVAKLLFKLRNKLAGKKIIILLPSLLRYEVLMNKKYRSLVPNNADYLDNLPSTGDPESHLEHKILMATMLVKTLTENHDCSFFHWHPGENVMEETYRTVLGSLAVPKNLMLDRAADDKHYGARTHKGTAEFMLAHLKK